MFLKKKHPMKSKTIWSGISSIIIGVASCLQKDYAHGIPMILAGIATIYGRMTAEHKIGLTGGGDSGNK